MDSENYEARSLMDAIRLVYGTHGERMSNIVVLEYCADKFSIYSGTRKPNAEVFEYQFFDKDGLNIAWFIPSVRGVTVYNLGDGRHYGLPREGEMDIRQQLEYVKSEA